jgi:uncharacterized protein (DUF1778 family)
MPDSKKAAQLLRVNALQVRVTDKERDLIEECAEAKGLSVSGWMRMKLLEGARREARREEKR